MHELVTLCEKYTLERIPFGKIHFEEIHIENQNVKARSHCQSFRKTYDIPMARRLEGWEVKRLEG